MVQGHSPCPRPINLRYVCITPHTIQAQTEINKYYINKIANLIFNINLSGFLVDLGRIRDVRSAGNMSHRTPTKSQNHFKPAQPVLNYTNGNVMFSESFIKQI